jgi:hypothetical protein
METDLFTWSSWDLVTDTCLQFYGCMLKVPIGRFNIGETVPIIIVDFEHGFIQLLDKGKASAPGALFSEHKVRMVLND